MMAWTNKELGQIDIRYWLVDNPDKCPNCGEKWFSPFQNAYPHWMRQCIKDKESQ